MGLFPGELYSLVDHSLTLWAHCAKTILVLFCSFSPSLPLWCWESSWEYGLVGSMMEKMGFFSFVVRLVVRMLTYLNGWLICVLFKLVSKHRGLDEDGSGGRALFTIRPSGAQWSLTVNCLHDLPWFCSILRSSLHFAFSIQSFCEQMETKF